MRLATLACSMALAACSPPPMSDAFAHDATDTLRDTPRDVHIGAPWRLEVRVVDENGVALSGAAVRAERSEGEFVEGETGTDGIARLALDDAAPWDVTAAMRERSAMSALRVDGPLEESLALSRRIAAVPTRVGVNGSVTGLSRTGSAWLPTIAGGHAQDPMRATTFRGDYETSSDPGAFYPPLRVAAFEYDLNGDLANGAIGETYPRNGTPIADAVVMFPSPPRTPLHAVLYVEFPPDGLLAASGHFFQTSAFVGRFGPSTIDSYGVARVTDPVDGVAEAHFQYFDGDLAPRNFLVSTRAIGPVNLFVQINLAEIAPMQTIRAPSIDVLEAAGSTLGDVAFAAAGDTLDRLEFVASDALGTVWRGFATHVERPLPDRRLPRLPSTLTLEDLVADPTVYFTVTYSRDRVVPAPTDPSIAPYRFTASSDVVQLEASGR